MTEEVKDVDILMPGELSVTLAGETHVVGPFKLGKSLRMMEYLSELLEGGDLAQVLKAGASGDQAEIWMELSRRLPSLFRTARPLVFKVLALTLIPNKRLAEIDEDDESYEVEIKKWVGILKEEADTEKALELMVMAIDGIGINAIRKNFPKLLQRMGSK